MVNQVAKQLVKKSWVIFFALFCLLLTLNSNATVVKESYWAQYKTAKKLVADRQYQQALDILSSLLIKQENFSIYILAAEAAKSLGHLQQALFYYQRANQLVQSEGNEYKLKALFGIAQMQLELRNYDNAGKTYQQILNLRIGSKERELATSGFRRAIQLKQGVLVPAKKTIVKVDQSPKEKPVSVKVVQLKQDKILSAEQIAKIRLYVNNGDGAKAYQLLKPYLRIDNTATIYLWAGHSVSLMAQPKLAMRYYKKAYVLAQAEQDAAIKQIALFGIARIYMALKQYTAAEKTYTKILRTKLSKEDRIIAQSGLMASKQAIISDYISKGDERHAYSLLQTMLAKHHQYDDYIFAGKMMEWLDRPEEALHYYKYAYKIAIIEKNISRQRISLMKIAAMQMWLDRYVRATKSYRKLLTYHLDAKTYEEAQAGLVKSLAYRGRIRSAYAEIPKNMIFTNPNMVIAAMQTTMWAGWGDLCNDYMHKYQHILKKISRDSHLGRDLTRVEILSRLETSPNQVSPSFSYFDDSERFFAHRYELTYRRVWSQTWVSFISKRKNFYSQHGRKLQTDSIVLRQMVRPHRNVVLNAQIEPIKIGNWNTSMWSLSGDYRSNDYYALNLGVNREYIESFDSFDNHITYDTYSVGLLLSPLPYVDLYGSAYKNKFSDNNTRDGFYFNGSILIFPQFGISAGVRIRGYNGKFQSPNYFNPDRYLQKLLTAGISRRFATTWRYFIRGGYGTQTIKPNPLVAAGSGPSWLYQLGIRGPIKKHGYVTLEYGRFDQASTFVDSEDYRYQEIRLSFYLSW
ncbi:MAG: hypothetical protein PVI75_06170 [Gammaproteobacteria bacterium]|jgi:hypothetical protein